jgi:hypothetical protein
VGRTIPRLSSLRRAIYVPSPGRLSCRIHSSAGCHASPTRRHSDRDVQQSPYLPLLLSYPAEPSTALWWRCLDQVACRGSSALSLQHSGPGYIPRVQPAGQLQESTHIGKNEWSCQSRTRRFDEDQLNSVVRLFSVAGLLGGPSPYPRPYLLVVGPNQLCSISQGAIMLEL